MLVPSFGTTGRVALDGVLFFPSMTPVRRGHDGPQRTGVMERKSSTPSKATILVIPNEGTNTGGQLWGHGGGAIIEEVVTSALNVRSW